MAKFRIPKTVTVDESKYAVTAIAGNAFKDNTSLKKVVIGNNIVRIGETLLPDVRI